MNISSIAIEDHIWKIRLYLCQKYGYSVDESSMMVDPIRWYIWSSRASVDFLKCFLNKRAYMLGRCLHKYKGSYEEIIRNIKDEIGYGNIRK